MEKDSPPDGSTRQCPTIRGDAGSLIMHQISTPTCQSRQDSFYHKCHRCVFRGKPAGWVPEPKALEKRA